MGLQQFGGFVLRKIKLVDLFNERKRIRQKHDIEETTVLIENLPTA